MRPKLYEQYKAQAFDASWLPYLMNDYRTYNLPTEFVVREAMICTPQQGRIYRTDLFAAQLPGKMFVTTRDRLYDAAQKSGRNAMISETNRRWSITDLGEEVFMVEHYEDHGDDGHTDMQLTGYIFVPASGLELVDVYGRKQFAYCKTLQEMEMNKWKTWKCDLCGKGQFECEGHIGEGFQ